VEEGDLWVLLRHREDVRVEVAEGRREEHGRAVEVDHALHGLLDVEGLGDLLFLQDLDAGGALDGFGALVVRLVVAVVVLGPDVEEADGRSVRGDRTARPSESDRAEEGGEQGQEEMSHVVRPLGGGRSGLVCLAPAPPMRAGRRLRLRG
jgi:hypothetical protein